MPTPLVHCLPVLLLALLLPASQLRAKTFADVAQEARQALAEAEAELAALRQTVAEQKRAISRRYTELEREKLSLDKRATATAANAESHKSANEASKRANAARHAEYVAIRSALLNFAKRLNQSLPSPEFELAKPAIDAAETLATDDAAAPSETLAAQLAVVKSSLERVRSLLGGRSVPGLASVSPTASVEGQYLLFGPLAFFSDGAQTVGIAIEDINLAYPAVFGAKMPPKVTESIRQLVATGGGSIPFDPTNGDAVKILRTQDSFVEHIVKGGVTMVPLLGMFLAAFVVAVFKTFEIASVRIPSKDALPAILEALKTGGKPTALALARSIKGPFGDLLATGVENVDQPKEVLEEALYDRLLAAQPKLERFIAFIALTAAAAPLLGLLGTVTGMIQTFKSITVHGTGDPATLSDGISVALITTEYGLIAAVPCLLVQALLSRVAKSKLALLERTAVAFVNGAR